MLLLLFALACQAESKVPDLDFEVAFPDVKFTRPVAIACPPDGSNRLFVLEQPGRVLWFDVEKATDAHVALDMVDQVLSRGNEEGLLGIAFHPRFKTTHEVFLQYSAPKSDPNQRHNVVSRFTTDPAGRNILRESEKIIMEVKKPYENHNGGVLQFGPDGYLYIGLGDGGSGGDPHGNAQNLKTMLGKFLRIDVDTVSPGKAYGIPKDNPFVGRDDALPEIWSYGWRNPWGYHFDRKTGVLWSADVGQDKYEEIDIVVKGGNYGWSVKEGLHDFKGGTGSFIDPVVELAHAKPNGPPGANSITGGCVYRGTRLPSVEGIYLYGDFVTGFMWGLRYEGGRVLDNKVLFEFKMKQITTFGEDRDGEVYWATFGDGRLYRFRLK